MSLYLERLRDAIRRALAQTVKRNDELVGIIRKVRRIHTPKPWMGVQMCDECMRRYPCRTVRVLDGEAATQDESEVD